MSHMTEQDRCIIENLLNAGKTPRSIAKELGRSHSTVLRELQKHRKENEADINGREISVFIGENVSGKTYAKFRRRIVRDDVVNARWWTVRKNV